MIKIEKVNNRTVYDITVEDNHNFYANNILVHNCAEILEVSGKIKHPNGEIHEHIAVCNLASIALPKFVKKTKKSITFDYTKLYEVAYQATINLNRVIDVNKYPVNKAEISNRSTRPIGLGIQGLADVFFLYNTPYGSELAKELNRDIFETIYFAACQASTDLAEKEGPYEFWEGSPASKGILQFDLWGVTPKMYDWSGLKAKIAKVGMRNSLHTALMPTASCQVSTAKIKTTEGIKSYQDIMTERGIDFNTIEKTNEQQWIKFETPLMVETRFGVKEAPAIFYNGNVETFKIEMEDGTIFETSGNHKFLVEYDNTLLWLETGDIKKLNNIKIVTDKNEYMNVVSVTVSGVKPTWDITVNDVNEYIMENGCVSHNTASIFGNEASAEAQTSNMYSRRVLSGEFIIINKHLVKDLNDIGLWSEDMRQLIIANEGSIQNINAIPAEIKEVYKTAWEIPQRLVIDMYQDRGAYIDQTQSMNIFMKSPNFTRLTAMHFYGWGGGVTPDIKETNPKWGATPEKALKTGSYYLRSTNSQEAVKFTITAEKSEAPASDDTDCLMCSA